MDSATKQKQYRERKRKKEHIQELLYKLVYDEMVTLLAKVEYEKNRTTVYIEYHNVGNYIMTKFHPYGSFMSSKCVFELLVHEDKISLSHKTWFGEVYTFN